MVALLPLPIQDACCRNLALAYLYAAQAIGAYFEDSSLHPYLPAVETVTRPGGDKDANVQAMSGGLLAAAVAAKAIKGHLTIGQDITVSVHFNANTLTQLQYKMTWPNSFDASRRDSWSSTETGAAEFYIRVTDTTNAEMSWQFPIAFEKRQNTTGLVTGIVDENSSRSTKSWREMDHALQTHWYKRDAMAYFTKILRSRS